MEIRELRSFLAVVRCGSFTAAARELGYTQSAISQHVAALELELGQSLVGRRPVRPTSAGERLAEHAARIVLRLDVAKSELSELHHEAREVVVDACPLAAPWLLASALRAVRAVHPSLRVSVRSVHPDAALADVASGAADLALVDGMTTPDQPLAFADAGLLVSSALVESPLVVVLPADHPLQGRASIDLETLADAPWIVAPGVAGIRFEAPWGVPTGRGGSILYEGSDVPTLLALVAAGHGAALLPPASCKGADGISTVPLRSPQLVHRTELLTLRDRGARHAGLVEALRARSPLGA